MLLLLILLLMLTLHNYQLLCWNIGSARCLYSALVKLYCVLLYAFFCVIHRSLKFIRQHFRTLYLFHLPAYEDGTDRVFQNVGIQDDQKVSVHPMITVQKNLQKYFKHFQSLTMIT
jgi:hypothetical protein